MAEDAPPPHDKDRSATAGCSLSCASLFLFAAVAWPLLHVVSRTYEPEILVVSIFIGGPAFLVGNILAIFACRSTSSIARNLAKGALDLMWGSVALFFLLAIAVQLMANVHETS